LSVHLPQSALPGIRMLALPSFPKLSVAAIWSGLTSKLGRIFVEEAEAVAQTVKPRMSILIKGKDFRGVWQVRQTRLWLDVGKASEASDQVSDLRKARGLLCRAT